MATTRHARKSAEAGILELAGEELAYLLEEIRLSFWVDFTEQDIVETATAGDELRILDSSCLLRSPYAGGSTIDQAWTAFQELLSGASGIASAAITRQMRFPEDLNLL